MKRALLDGDWVQCNNLPRFNITMRGGAVTARWAHNPKANGSNPFSARNFDNFTKKTFFLLKLYSER